MSDCCGEYGCRRKQPIEIQRGPFSGIWYAITRYKRDGSRIDAQEKHALDPFLCAALDYALEHKDEVAELYERQQADLERHRAEVAERRAAREKS